MTHDIKKTKFYLYNGGGDNAIAVNWEDFWVFIEPGDTKFDGVTIDSPEFCEKYSEILSKQGTNSFYEIALDHNQNPYAFCCYDPDRSYVRNSDLIQLITEVADSTQETDVKNLQWRNPNGEIIKDFTNDEELEM